METLALKNDIQLITVSARSFPDGITEAHQRLIALIPFSPDRKYFGLSRPENGAIAYYAAAKELYEGEAESLFCQPLVLESGNYVCMTVTDFARDVFSIDRTFQQLLSQPGLDPNGYCVEWYLNEKDVMCMIRLEDL